MVDFLRIKKRQGKRGVDELYPGFFVIKSSDLMIKNNEFVAIWLEDENRWSTEEDDAISLIDNELMKYYEENKNKFDNPTRVLLLRDAENGMIDRWHKFCKNQMIECYHKLNQKIIFANTETTKKDYASIRLPYPLEAGSTAAYDKLMSTLYSDEERHKLEWAIGSIVTGDSKKLQKFIVLYGERGTGKSTVMDIIAKLFDGYCSVFDAKSLGSSNQQFALEAFRDNPLVSIQHDGDLSKIEDNTRLNSLVSHEKMIVNEKNKSLYKNDFKTFLFMGSNSPVRITDARSGLLRRLIDVSPTGNTLPKKEYMTCIKQIDFELGAIANHCKEVYLSDPDFYNDYVPVAMLGASNSLYNFVMDCFFDYGSTDGVTLDSAWKLYKVYCDEARVYYPLSKQAFREDLKPYFKEFKERYRLDDGTRVRSYYLGFNKDKYSNEIDEKPETFKVSSWLDFKEQSSVFDSEASNYPAQYASDGGTPLAKWSEVDTTLASIDTSRLHYVKVPENHIVIDFDIPDSDGNKSLEKNMEAASKWPQTYAELSKSGKGIHLHYIYTGDISKVSRIFDDYIEIKIFNGNSSLRRKLTKCNALPIATISSGLPLQVEKKKIDGVKIKTQKKLLEMIERNLNKEIHGATKPSCDFIYKIVEDAYNDGFSYEITAEMKKRIMDFAKNSTHQSDSCVKLMKKMHYQSKDLENTMDNNNRRLRELIKKIYIDEKLDPVGKIDQIYEALENAYNSKIPYDLRDIRQSLVYFATDKPKGSENVDYCLGMVHRMRFASDEPIEFDSKDEEAPIAFYDIEVYPNLLLIAWMLDDDDAQVVKMFNPTAAQVEDLLKYRLIGFNCRRYDNHLIYARTLGWDNERLYNLSQKIVTGSSRDCFFGEAYGLSYTDVYDFASAGNKMSLKKLEIKMGIHHQEMGIPWDQPVPEEQWPLVGEYCENDVRATRAAFYYLKGDWTARQILADLAGMTVNDTTNSLTTRIIFGKNRHPQDQFCNWELAKPVKHLPDDVYRFLSESFPDMMSQTHGPANSLLPYYPGYDYTAGVSTYRGEVIGEGGYVYAEPGIWVMVFLLDIASMHPHSVEALCLFGPIYTAIFKSIVDGRVNIKHEAWSKVDKMLDGKLKPYVQKVKDGLMTAKELANALKTAINSVYGLTAAKFDNPFKDERNKDNIVAKRGALFMVELKHAVQEQGFTVAHIKTDSIKIPNATPEIVKFVQEFGKSYGYTFEHEATYEKMCLVNNAVYIAKYADGEHEFELPTGEKIMTPWTATGEQFQVPYVFKTLFSKTPYKFDDFCETKSVTSAIYLDFNEDLNPEKIPGEKSDKSSDSDGEAHNYQFVGKIGQFCPVVPGCGGGVLLRLCSNGKYAAVEGTKGYRWMESEVLRKLHPDDWQNYIDMSYYTALVDKAVEAISQYGDFEWFAS